MSSATDGNAYVLDNASNRHSSRIYSDVEKARKVQALTVKNTVPIASNAPSNPPSIDRFAKFAAVASNWLGSKWAFAGAGLVIVIWALTGPLFHFSDTWQLVINTGTTIVTFLMVFLIQNTQNRDARAINLKLNELIRAIDKARDQMIDIENLTDIELDELQAKYEGIKAAWTQRNGNVNPD
ncbi:low affinity iron permease family protein [Acidicapsa ligni]|uniref:low affinity iron permease family protein n=1 Tax=Acidicapsa ligni TaxID=542300 RepID=UPI0021DFE480|nr:low affinity iron permease family protein [Acidicapsa ligni]